MCKSWTMLLITLGILAILVSGENPNDIFLQNVQNKKAWDMATEELRKLKDPNAKDESIIFENPPAQYCYIGEHEGWTTVLEELSKGYCPNGATSCEKVHYHYKETDQKITLYGCSTPYDDIPSKCVEYDDEQLKIKACACADDLCNDGPTLKAGFIMTMIMTFFTAKLAF